MSHRGVVADRLERLRDEATRLVEAVLDGEGATSVQARRAAFAGRADDPSSRAISTSFAATPTG